MDGRLVLLHGWGANGDDLKPLGDQPGTVKPPRPLMWCAWRPLNSTQTNRGGDSGTACSRLNGMPCPRQLTF